jgi:hypothetical protein
LILGNSTLEKKSWRPLRSIFCAPKYSFTIEAWQFRDKSCLFELVRTALNFIEMFTVALK